MINTSLSLQAQNAAVPVERNTPVTSLSDAGAVTVSPENPETKDGYTASRSKERKYTFLVYEAGANNLDDCIVADINDMESAPPSDNYHIVMQHSRYHIKPSTASFLSAAIAHALESRYFMEKLQEIVKDRQLAEKYGQLFKDPEQCSSIAQILLNKNPGLNDHLDEVTQHVIKDTVAGDQAIIDALKKTTDEVLSQIAKTRSSINERSENTCSASIDCSIPPVQEETVEKSARKNLYPQHKPLSSRIRIRRRKTSVCPNLVHARQTDQTGQTLLQGDYSEIYGSVKDYEVSRDPAWRGARRYVISHDDDTSRITSRTLDNLGQIDMSKSQTLADFLIWGIENYPAEHYVFYLSDHGNGFKGALEERGTKMTLPEIREALEIVKQKKGISPDIILFDACFMAQLEVAHELKDSGKYLVASEEMVGGGGFRQKDLFSMIDQALSEGKTDPKEVASLFVEAAKKVNKEEVLTESVINLEAINEVTKAVDGLASHILDNTIPLDEVRESLKITQRFYQGEAPCPPYDAFVDLWDFADKLEHNPHITSRLIKKDTKAIKKAVEKAVVKEQHSEDEDFQGSHGLSIHAPRRQKMTEVKLMQQYDKTRMARETRWSELIEKLTDYEDLVKKSNVSMIA